MQRSNESLRDLAYGAIRNAILTLEFKPREHLVESSLAAMLEVSRTPVREALNKLELEGLVQKHPNVGYVVTDISAEDVEDLYSMREALEGLAVRCAVPRYTSEHFQIIEDVLAQTQAATQAGDWQRLLELNSAFHTAICQPCGRQRLLRLIKSLEDQCLRFRSLILVLQDVASENSFRDHARIYEVLRRGDPRLAEEAIKSHLRVGPSRVGKAMPILYPAALGNMRPLRP